MIFTVGKHLAVVRPHRYANSLYTEHLRRYTSHNLRGSVKFTKLQTELPLSILRTCFSGFNSKGIIKSRPYQSTCRWNALPVGLEGCCKTKSTYTLMFQLTASQKWDKIKHFFSVCNVLKELGLLLNLLLNYEVASNFQRRYTDQSALIRKNWSELIVIIAANPDSKNTLDSRNNRKKKSTIAAEDLHLLFDA